MKCITELIDLFNLKGLEWCFLREKNNIFLDSGIGQDVDVWCSEEALPVAIKIIMENGWLVQGGRRVCSVTGNCSTAIRFQHSKACFTLELWVSCVRAGPVIFLSEDEISSSRLKDDNYYYLSLPYQLLMLTIRPIILGKDLKEYGSRINSLVNLMEESEIKKWRKLSEKYISANELTISQDGKYKYQLESKSLHIHRLGIWAKSVTISLLSGYSCSLVKKNISRILGFNGLFITLVGVDGAGKSTLLESVSSHSGLYPNSSIRYLGRSRGNSVIIEFFRSIIFRIFRINPTFVNKDEIGDEIEYEETRFKGEQSILKTFALFMYFVEYWFRYLAVKAYVLLKKNYIFGDRGSLDLALMYGLGELPERIGKILPKAHLSVFCWASPNTILGRKEERTRVEIVRQQELLGGLISKIRPHKRLQICTENNLDQCVKVINFAIAIVSAARVGRLDVSIASTLMSIINQPIPDDHEGVYDGRESVQ